MKRKLPVVVISDTHLGTYGCHAKELLHYLRSIEPEILVLNGDIIDIWNLNKSWFPKAHMQVVRQILKMAEKGTKVYYITGNHDEALRKYEGTNIGNVSLEDKLILSLDGKIVWFFHGDIFDATTKGWAKILAKLGGKGYDILILLNRFINQILHALGREKMSLSKKVKSGVKQAVQWINNFEITAAELAIDQQYDVVVCGHIHQPEKRIIRTQSGAVLYLNSGDWVENCTSLEYYEGSWHIFEYQASGIAEEIPETLDKEVKLPVQHVVAGIMAFNFKAEVQ
ncbi:MAG: UDP-2,3-diacylglucosamine diphosphatase [Saprospiraceae bacterium]|nr:UDP-2,3-diacylglucosamine diphosphatase [Saprospiraceae bacterium]